MRIGVFSDFRAANTVYRAVPVVGLGGRGHEIAVDQHGERREHPALHGCDVVHVYRYAGRTTQRLARTLREQGTAVVWDIDDDLSTVPERMRGRHRTGGLEEQQMLRDAIAMAGLADVVTTTSEPLAALYRERGVACVRVVPNYLPDVFAPGGVRPRDGVVVGWIASAEHQHDVERLDLSATLRRLLDAHPHVRVASVGIRFELPPERYRHQLVVQPAALPQEIATYDVGIAPLDDIPFNRARSDVKVKEYAAVGVPWLASPIGPYAGLGEKQGGRLVADDGWLDALGRMVSRERERRKLAKRAARWGREQLASRNLGAWEDVMVEAVERARHRG